MDNFDIICTATLRPDLLRKTFDTHWCFLFKENIKKARLIMNVDWVGSKNPNQSINQIFKYISSIPFRDIEFNISKSPSFPKAFCWTVSKIKSDLVFNLEEDWEMLIDIDFERMVTLFNLDKKLAHLRLSMFRSDYVEGEDILWEGRVIKQHQMKTWNKFIRWNGEFFEIPQNLKGTIGWAGHPSLNRSDFLKGMVESIDCSKNHEKQIKGNHPLIVGSNFGVFHPFDSSPAIKDIGREWMAKNNFKKKGAKAFFTEWEVEPGKKQIQEPICEKCGRIYCDHEHKY